MDKAASSPKPSLFSLPSPLKSNFKSSSAKARSLCWQRSVKEDNANWRTVDRPEPVPTPAEELRRTRMSKRRCSAPSSMPLAMDMQSRKPSLKSIQMMKMGSSEVPSVCIAKYRKTSLYEQPRYKDHVNIKITYSQTGFRGLLYTSTKTETTPVLRPTLLRPRGGLIIEV